MKTSEDVRTSGLYASDCCGEETIFDANDCFSRCPRCERLCEWELVENLSPCGDQERGTEEKAA
jgi:hypothetical protein